MNHHVSIGPHYHIRNAHELFEARQTFGQKAADAVANLVGSWKFIIVQSFLIVLWVAVNSAQLFLRWDPYPFILMNLCLSMQAALTAPIIMMSQNRQADKDRVESHNDYEVNLKAEMEVSSMLSYLEQNHDELKQIMQLMQHVQKQLDTMSNPKQSGGSLLNE